MVDKQVERSGKLYCDTLLDAMDKLGIEGVCRGVKPRDHAFRMADRAFTVLFGPFDSTNSDTIGNLLVATRTPDGPKLAAKGGCVQEMDWDGNVVCEYRDDVQHHDFHRCESGNLTYLGKREMAASTRRVSSVSNEARARRHSAG